MSRRLMDVKTAAAYLGFDNYRDVYRLIAAGEIAHIRRRDEVNVRRAPAGKRRGQPQRFRRPGRVYLLESDCDTWLAMHRVPAKHETDVPSVPTRTLQPLQLPARHERRFS